MKIKLVLLVIGTLLVLSLLAAKTSNVIVLKPGTEVIVTCSGNIPSVGLTPDGIAWVSCPIKK